MKIKFKNWHNTNGLVSGVLRLCGLTIVSKEKKPRYKEKKPRYKEKKPRYKEKKPRYINSKIGYNKIDCPECHGGIYSIPRPSDASTVRRCVVCNGSGKINVEQCQFCLMTAGWYRTIRTSNKKFVKYYLCQKHKDRENKEFTVGTINMEVNK